MTKKEFIEKLKPYSDDCLIALAFNNVIGLEEDILIEKVYASDFDLESMEGKEILIIKNKY